MSVLEVACTDVRSRLHESTLRALSTDPARAFTYARAVPCGRVPAWSTTRLIEVTSSIRETVRLIHPPRLRIDRIKGQTLNGIARELGALLDSSFLLASDEVYEALRTVSKHAAGLWRTSLVCGAIVLLNEVDGEAQRTGQAADECHAEARRVRTMMRDELRSGV